MAIENLPKKRKVWQDIRPAKQQPRPTAEIKPIEKLPRKKLRLPTISKKVFIIFLIISAIVGLAVAIFWFINLPQDIKNNILNSNTSEQTNVDDTPVLSKGSPEFTTVSPNGKDMSSLGGWTRISPESTAPVYAYADSIDGVTITVSEQALPEEFNDAPYEQLEILAQGFHATQKITVGDLVVYVGTSMDGHQSIIFIKNNLLVLIKSTQIISNDDWISYIESLK